MENETHRRLSAIVFADIAGFSRLMGEDEAGALARLQALRTRLDPLIAEFEGRIVKSMGDGLLLEFPSVVNAVALARALHELVDELEAGAPAGGAIRFRVAVHLGDVIVDGAGDIFGDDVNVAARLQEAAAPGGVVLSNAAYEHLDASQAADFVDGGRRSFKNIRRPIRIWRWTKTAPATTPSPAAPPVILVEPFKFAGEADLAEDAAEDLHDDLVDALSHRSGVKVATTPTDPPSHVYELHGRLRVAAGRCRAQLSMTVRENGEVFWSERIAGEAADLDRFIDDAAAKAATALRAQINAYGGAAVANRPDAELDLPDLLAKAAFFFYHHDAQSAELSQATMAAAVERAPENPMALAMRAWSIAQMAPFDLRPLPEPAAAEALDLAEKAVDHGPQVDFAFHCRAWLRLWLKADRSGCRADAERALRVNPGYHKGLQDRALADLFEGATATGVAALQAAVDEVPAEPITPLLLAMAGLGQLLLGDTAAARACAREGYETKPLARVTALAFAIVAADDADVVASPEFQAMCARRALSVSDAYRLPFADGATLDLFAARLRAAGLPE